MKAILELSREDLMAAISEGVRQAFANILRGVDLRDALKEGAELGLATDAGEAIKEGVNQAFDIFPSQILDAIYQATKEAMRGRA